MYELCYDSLEQDRELIERHQKMTIIIAMKESDDSLLIGADTISTEDDNLRGVLDTKLYKHNTHNIVWGCGGDRELSRHEFNPWLQSLSIEGDWEWLKSEIADKVAELNGRQRESL